MAYQKKLQVAEEIGLREQGLSVVELGVDDEGNIVEEVDYIDYSDFLVLVDELMKPYPNIYDCIGSKEAERMNDDFSRVERYKVATLAQTGRFRWVDASRVFVLEDEQFIKFSELMTADKPAKAISMLRELIPAECGTTPGEKLRIREEEVKAQPTVINFTALGRDIPEDEDQKVGTVRFYPPHPDHGWELTRFAVRGKEVYVKGVLKRVKGGGYDIDVLNVHLNKEQMAFTKKAVMVSYARGK